LTVKKKRVVIVDDSSLSRAILREILEADGDIEVVGEAQNGYEAVGVVDALVPDVVTMDIDMPGPSGLETIGFIMQKRPVPIIVVTGERLGEGSALGFHAIERGAVDFTSKPSITDAAAVKRLRGQVRAVAGMQLTPGGGDTAAAPPGAAEPTPQGDVEVVGLAAGIGGHRSLMRILRRIPREFPCTLAVVQHMAPRFGPAFARYLQQMTPMRVRLAGKSPMRVSPGELWVCDASSHLVFPSRGEIVAADEPPVRGYRPSASRLFEAMAQVYGRAAAGVLCAGSGDDGADGLRRLKDASGLVVVESVETAVPSDMPRAAAALKAVDKALPAELIADFLVGAFTDKSAKTTAPPSNLDAP
jgi:two-component system chemotaxis response regulator CheB